VSSRDIVVSTPAGTDYVHVLRAVVASLAARLDFPYDSIEDLKLAVDEACAHLHRGAKNAGQFVVRVAAAENGLAVSVTADGDRPSSPSGGLEGSLAWEILKALTDDPSYEVTDEGPTIRFTLHPR
jgi:serine/threonine-protein kinase RsbW